MMASFPGRAKEEEFAALSAEDAVREDVYYHAFMH